VATCRHAYHHRHPARGGLTHAHAPATRRPPPSWLLRELRRAVTDAPVCALSHDAAGLSAGPVWAPAGRRPVRAVPEAPDQGGTVQGLSGVSPGTGQATGGGRGVSQLDAVLLLLSLLSCAVSAWLLHLGPTAHALRPETRTRIAEWNLVFVVVVTLYFIFV
jgi:hypothetical protein